MWQGAEKIIENSTLGVIGPNLAEPPCPLQAEPAPPRLEICAAGDPRRAELECFVQAAFQRAHGAIVAEFLPLLLALRSPAGQLLGVAGYREAGAGPLFLEHYLGGPVEHVLAERVSAPVSRGRVAEIGNFATTGCRSGRLLIGMLIPFLQRQGHHWAVFTGTGSVRRIMVRMGLDLLELARARPEAVAEPQRWGRYYTADPRVMAGKLAAVVAGAAPGN